MRKACKTSSPVPRHILSSVNVNYYSVFRVDLEKREECWVFHSFISLSLIKKRKKKCESEETEFGLPPPDNAFTLLWGQMEGWYWHLVGASGSCPVFGVQVCWKQPFGEDDIIASHLRTATTCCGSRKDPKKSGKPQAADGTMSKTRDILSF